MTDATRTTSPTDTRARIVEVAAQVLREKGPAAVTTRGIAEGAGVQAPAIYRLFGDKDGLMDAVAEHVMDTYVSAKAAIVEAASVDDVDPLDDLRGGWMAQMDFGLANPTLFRLLSDPNRVVTSPAAVRGKAVLEARVHRVALTGRLRVSEQRAVDLIQAAGTGVIQSLLATPVEKRDAGLGEAMYNAVLGQILTDTDDGGDTSAIAVAVAFRAVAPELTMLSEAERAVLAEWLDRAIAGL